MTKMGATWLLVVIDGSLLRLIAVAEYVPESLPLVLGNRRLRITWCSVALIGRNRTVEELLIEPTLSSRGPSVGAVLYSLRLAETGLRILLRDLPATVTSIVVNGRTGFDLPIDLKLIDSAFALSRGGNVTPHKSVRADSLPWGLR